MRPPLWPGLLVAALAVVVFAPALGAGFINYDDGPYVVDNPRVREGLTAENIGWALTSVKQYYWHPLTWLSLQLDATLWGAGPAGFHATNVVLHAVSCLLVYVLLAGWTGRVGEAAVAAALFGWHPLRVESVAWVAERKDVLAVLLALVALAAYTRWVKERTAGRWRVLAAAVACAYLAKPSTIVLPVLFLLVDRWPLGRGERLWALVREKAVFVAAAVPVALLTLYGQAEMKALPSGDLSRAAQMANAAIAPVAYLGKTFWPEPLAVLYPYREQTPWLAALGAAALVAALTAGAWRLRGGRPWVWFGWMWYLVALAPVSGVIQAGPQSMADRFTYLAHVGLVTAMVWTAAEWKGGRRWLAAGLVVAAVAGVRANAYTRLWKDSVTLFGHTVEVTGPNPVARHNLAFALAAEGRHGEALPHYREAIRLQPGYHEPHYNLGLSLYQTGAVEEAAAAFAESARRRPSYAEAHFSEARCLTELGRGEEALAKYERALAAGLPAGLASQAHNNAGALLARAGRFREALPHFEEAVRLDPGSAEARRNRDLLRGQLGGTGR